MTDRLHAMQIKAEKLHQSLTENQIPPYEIPDTIRSIDHAYKSIFLLLAIKSYPYSAQKQNDYYCKAKRAFYTFLDPNVDKQITETEVLMKINDTFPGGILRQFTLYLRDSNQYLHRVHKFLLQLNKRLNGQGAQHGSVHFRNNLQRSNSDVISELRKVVAIKKDANSNDVLEAFDEVHRIIFTARTNDLPRHISALLIEQQRIMETFGFNGQTARHLKLGKSVR